MPLTPPTPLLGHRVIEYKSVRAFEYALLIDEMIEALPAAMGRRRRHRAQQVGRPIHPALPLANILKCVVAPGLDPLPPK